MYWHMNDWYTKWVHPSCYSRPGCSCTDSSWFLALKLEHAHVFDTPLHGMSLDWHKAHDSVPRAIAFVFFPSVLCFVTGTKTPTVRSLKK